jgi:ubiquinone/menaquinone biosynthesis C-methylase UbiE
MKTLCCCVHRITSTTHGIEVQDTSFQSMAQMQPFSALCPCCAGPAIVALAVGVLSLLLFAANLMPSKTRKSPVVKVLIGFASLVVGIIMLGVGALAASKDLKSRFFAFWFSKMSESPMEIDRYRCDLIKNVGGRILEIGPGAGANFRCWGESSSQHTITRWEGIEVNKYFGQKLTDKHRQNNLTFPTHVHWINEDASNLNIQSNAFDAVVITHVLCSVPDVNAVLTTVARALKPGATYYFLEHVQADPANSKSHEGLVLWQQLLGPVLGLVGNGCQFKDTGRYLELATQAGGPLDGYSLNLTRFDAPMPLPPLVPHIIGTVTKPKAVRPLEKVTAGTIGKPVVGWLSND